MRQLTGLGKLKQDATIPEWWFCKPVPVAFCKGKHLSFSIRLESSNDSYPPDVDEAVSNFLALTDTDRLAASERVFRYYRAVVAIIPELDLGITDAKDIWNHIRPTNVSVDRYLEGDQAVYVRVLAQCDWDEEHGLQIVFRDGNTITLVGEHEDGSFVEDSDE